MKFIALKTCDGGAKGRISFCCKALKVTRQGFHEYLKNRNKPWKHEELAAKMMEILNEDECTIKRLRHNQPVSTATIDKLCEILKCPVDDVIMYVEKAKSSDLRSD